MIQLLLSEALDHEGISFDNMVLFHKDELIQILEGSKARDIFTRKRSAALARDGILHREGKSRKHMLTPRAVKTLTMINKGVRK